MAIDLKRLRVYLDDCWLSRMHQNTAVHVPSIVNDIAHAHATDAIGVAPLPVIPVAFGVGLPENTNEFSVGIPPSCLRPELDPAIRRAMNAWRAEVAEAIVEVLSTHPDFTDVCPTPPKGFWRK